MHVLLGAIAEITLTAVPKQCVPAGSGMESQEEGEKLPATNSAHRDKAGGSEE